MSDGFAHQLRLDQIRDGQRLDLIAGERERAAIAKRLDLEGIDRLEAHVMLAKNGHRVRVEGRLAASLTQSCVITREPVAAFVDEPFEFAFVPAPSDASPDEEVELSENELDTIFYDALIIDLGGAIADTLALSLDPFPRSAGADSALKEAGVMTEAEASPFAVLAKLRNSSKT